MLCPCSYCFSGDWVLLWKMFQKFKTKECKEPYNIIWVAKLPIKKKKKQKSELPNCFSTMTKYMCGNSYTINITYKFFTHLTHNTWPHKEKFVKLTCCLILMSTKAAKPAFPVPTSDLNTSEQTISTSN